MGKFSTVTPRSSLSSSLELSSDSETQECDEEEDYFAKFSDVTGWRSILLLQFQVQSTFAIIGGIYISYVAVLVDIAFALATPIENIHHNVKNTVSGLIYSFDVFYFMDVISMIIFKNVTWADMKLQFKARHGAILIVEFFSLIPLELIYHILVTPNMKIFYCLRFRYALRLLRFKLLYSQNTKYVRAHSYMLHILTHMGIVILLAVTTGSISYVLKCKGSCPYRGKGLSIFGDSLYLAHAVLTCRGVTSAFVEDTFLLNALMSFATLALNTYFMTNFLCEAVEMLKENFTYISIYSQISNTMESWKEFIEWGRFHNKFALAVKQYEMRVWEDSEGISLGSYLNKFIPSIMYKEISLDISIVPLKHSHLFRDEDIWYVCTLGATMKQKFCIPGEVIFKRKEYKSSMVYLVSGIVDVISEEDCETVILSLTSGTCLGESSLILDCASTCSVICKDVCQIAVLSRKAYLELGKVYPGKLHSAQERIKTRVYKSMAFRQITKYSLDKQEVDEKLGILTMKWLKYTLKKLLYGIKKTGDVYSRRPAEQLKQTFFCSRFLNLYVIAKEAELVMDSVFIRNKFPFILKPRTPILKMWNICVLILVNLLGLTFPLLKIFVRDALWYETFLIFITFCWAVDLYVTISTAIVTKYHSFRTLPEIAVENLTKVTFFLDIISTVPLEVFMLFITGTLHTYVDLFVKGNRLLKLYKLETFFGQILATTTKHVFLKYIKYLVYLSYVTYYSASVLYLLGCRYGTECKPAYLKFLREFSIDGSIKKIILSLYGLMQLFLDTSITHFPYISGLVSCLVLIFLHMVSFVMNTFFLAYTCAVETLNKQEDHRLFEFEYNLNTTMKCFNLHVKIRKRVWRYVKLQVKHAGVYFLTERQLFLKLPRDLFVMACHIQLVNYIRTLDLFSDLTKDMLSRVCSIGHVYLIPANEVIMNVGQVCSELHIIIDGSCSIRCVNGEKGKLEAGDNFSVLEACLNVPSLNKVVSLTPCKIISINYTQLKAMFLHSPSLYHNLDGTSRYFGDWNAILFLRNARVASASKLLVVKPKKSNFKSFGYNLKRRTVRYYEFHDAFPRWAVPLKYLLLRFSFHCNGRLVFYWEIARCIFATTACFLFPLSCLTGNLSSIYYYVMVFLDITLYIDIYLKHHLSYFNEKGIEITHPYMTAVHYWKHGLLVDLLSGIRHQYLEAVFSLEHRFWYDITRLLQMYRLSGLLRYVFHKRIVTERLWIMLHYFPGVFIFMNILGATYFSYNCLVNEFGMQCNENHWLSKVQASTPYEKYVFALLFVISALLNTGLSMIGVKTFGDISFFTCLCVMGYFFCNFFTARTIATNLSINHDLISYQSAMGSLVKFMSYKSIDKKLKREVINHFEYMWYKTKGKTIQNTFASFTTTFKTDVLYNIYGLLFNNSTIFPNDNESFFKSLLVDVKHEIYLKRGTIYKVNDVSGTIYLLLSGRVEVVGADHNRLLTLNMGSLFGNLDDCPLGRRTLSVVAAGHVEVLAFSSTVFYRHLSKFPRFYKHFRKLTAFNVDYLEETEKLCTSYAAFEAECGPTAEITASCSKSGIKRLLAPILKKSRATDMFENEIISLVSFFSYMLDMYGIATQNLSIIFILTVYLCDLFFVIKMYLKFQTSIEDEFGLPIVTRAIIRKKYTNSLFGFYFDVLTTLPFELMCFFFANRSLVWFICRTNRLVRIILVVRYLRIMLQKLNINVFLMQSLYLLLWFAVTTHTLACSLHVVLYKHDKNDRYKYLHSLQVVLNIATKLSIVLDVPDFDYVTAAWFLITIIGGKIIGIVFVAETCALIKMIQQPRSIYKRYIVFMKSYMEAKNVSLPLSERINNYINLFWIFHRGVHYPPLLLEAPYYLKEGVLNSMFGDHVRKHPILKHCHIDMIRQMAAEMITLVFFPGTIVTYTGETDQCMYFIQEGEVDVLVEDTIFSEVVSTTLHAGDMFGFNQGMYRRHIHEFTYKATKYTVIISLNREKWIYLLDFFPASKALIYDKQQDK